MRCLHLVAAMALLLGGSLVQKARALGTEELGNEPLSEKNYEAWKGIMPVVNDKARVYENWVNGNEHFYYRGGVKELNATLAHFAKVEVAHHVVVLRPGPGAGQRFDRTEIPCNWSLHVVGGLARRFAKDDIEDLEWQKDPVLTIYIAGAIDLDKIEFPKGVTLRTTQGDSPSDEKQAAVQKKIEKLVEERKKGEKK